MIINAAKAAEAARILEVELSGLTSKVMTNAYRAKAKTCHPDTHNDPEQWARISWALECLKRWLQNAPKEAPAIEGAGQCRACAGKGRIPVSKGFGKAMTLMCVMCNGSGQTPTGGESAHYGRD